jgi:hypothetical protein
LLFIYINIIEEKCINISLFFTQQKHFSINNILYRSKRTINKTSYPETYPGELKIKMIEPANSAFHLPSTHFIYSYSKRKYQGKRVHYKEKIGRIIFLSLGSGTIMSIKEIDDFRQLVNELLC